MTYSCVVGSSQRRARAVLDAVGPGAGKTGWQPSRAEMIEMRHCSREGLSIKQAFERMKPPCGLETFRNRANKLAILFDRNKGARTRAYGGR